MRILFVGAGGIGGYFGGRLLEAGQDVTFLVRPRRAAQLASTGLIVRSRLGDIERPAPVVMAEDLRESFDLILLSCKAYDLEAAMDSLAPAIGAQSAILPLLNGIRHLDVLQERFGGACVLGGQCIISAALDAEGRILHLNEAHSLTFGERGGARSARAEAIASAFAGARFEVRLSEAILQEMWEKFVFIASLAGITCLMRATIGDIVNAGAADLAGALLDECAGIAAREGYAPREAALERSRTTLTAQGSALTASMLRDIEQGGRIEADHIIGDLLRRAGGQDQARLLRIVYAHLKAYEARRAREG
jgi:2-dehydropantoate 2-reductase